MLKALKVVMIVWGALGILWGLGMIFAPQQMGAMQGYVTEGPAYIVYFLALLGVSFVVSAAFVITAALGDLLKNILWVQFATALAVLMVATAVYAALMGFVTFEQVLIPLILDAVFAVLLLAFYPYRAAARRRK